MARFDWVDLALIAAGPATIMSIESHCDGHNVCCNYFGKIMPAMTMMFVALAMIQNQARPAP